MYIYSIINKINGKRYIGQTIRSISERFTEHCKPSRDKKSALGNAIKKYGKSNFYIEYLSNCISQEQLNNAEEYFIEYYNTFGSNGYNLTNGGEHPEFTEEELNKRKIRRKLQLAPIPKGYKQSNEWIEKRIRKSTETKRLKELKKPKKIKIFKLDSLHLVRPVIKDEKEFFISINEVSRLGFGQKEIIKCCKNLLNLVKKSKFRYANIDEIKYYLKNESYKLNKILNNKYFKKSISTGKGI